MNEKQELKLGKNKLRNELEEIQSKEEKPKQFGIWSEGYLATGMDGIPSDPHFWGMVEAETFQEACNKLAEKNEGFKNSYDPKRMTYWGCRLYPSFDEANEFLKERRKWGGDKFTYTVYW
jgi:hypothetical protein